jgi:hypothetical protein
VQPAFEIEARRPSVNHTTLEELRATDEAMAAVARGEITADEDVRALFAKHTAVIPSGRNSL